MKLPKQKNKKITPIIIIVFVFLFISGITSAYYFKLGPFSKSDQTSNEEKKAGSEIKKQSVEQATEDDKTQTGSDPVPAPKSIEGSSKKSVGMEVTAANQDDASLYIRTIIQAVVDSGTCSLHMTGPAGKEYSASADIQSLPSSSTCKGFNIPLDQLAPGTWNIAIEFNNDALVASSAKEVVIR